MEDLRRLVAIFWLWLALGASVVLGKEHQSLSVLDLVPLNTTTTPKHGHSAYGIELIVGRPQQKIVVIPALYLPYMSADLDIDTPGSQPELYLPSKTLCKNEDASDSDWNKFTSPEDGEFISTVSEGEGLTAGMFLVEWRKSVDPRINLTLRKGQGNVTVIEKDITNDGSYPWNVTKTAQVNSLLPGDDYSLMIWSEDPPRRSFSGMFTLGTSKNEDETAQPPQTDDRVLQCLNYMLEHGGYYNDSADFEFFPREMVSGTYTARNTSWSVDVDGVGTTDVAWGSSLAPVIANLSEVPMAKFQRASDGIGAVSLAALQRRRNAALGFKSGTGVVATNVVGMFIGRGDIAGSIVMGGYDNALVQHDDSLIYKRVGTELYVELESITYNRDRTPKIQERADSKEDDAVQKAADRPYVMRYSRAGIQLSYTQPGLRLPKSVLDDLLPKVGNPKFDTKLGYYVYSEEPPLDWSLTFTFRNNTRSFSIDVPGASLIHTAADINSPFSMRVENQQTTLRVMPTPFGDEEGAYLGQAVVSHLYVVDDNSLGKFHISPVNLTAARAEVRNVIPGSYMLLQGDNRSTLRTEKNIGAILGGSLGGAALLAVAAAAVAFVVIRRRSAHESKHGKQFGGASATKIRSNSPAPGNPEKDLRSRHISLQQRDLGYGPFVSSKDLEAAFPLPPNSAPSSATVDTTHSGFSQTRLTARSPSHQLSPISPISPMSPLAPAGAVAATAANGTWARRGSRQVESPRQELTPRISRHDLEAESPHYFKPHPPPPTQHIARLISIGSLRNSASTQSLPVTPGEAPFPVHASRSSTIRRASAAQTPSDYPTPSDMYATPASEAYKTPGTFPLSTSSSDYFSRPRPSNNSLRITPVEPDLDSEGRSLSRTASIARVMSPREIALTPASSVRRKSDHGLLLSRRLSEKEKLERVNSHRRHRSEDGMKILPDSAAETQEAVELEAMEKRSVGSAGCQVRKESPNGRSDGARTRGRPSSELEGWGGLERR